MTEIGPIVCRSTGMFATSTTYLIAPIWILVTGWLARLKSHPVMSELLDTEADLLKAMQG